MPPERIHLACLPTPLYRLNRLSERLGIDLWIKRDDLTGFGMGGNKVRKAEYLLADALRNGATDVITAGAAQSNHARVIAAAARAVGLQPHLVLSGAEPEVPRGNILLDRLSDAQLTFVADSSERNARMESLAEELRAAGKAPYLIPIGGSNAVGAMGYVNGCRELAEQLAGLTTRRTVLVFATSSGGTYGGLLAGRALAGLTIELLGIRVDRDPEAAAEAAKIATETVNLAGGDTTFSSTDVQMEEGYVGDGYGIPTTAGSEALRLVWQTEGILLDPVYSAKAMAGLLDLGGGGRFAGVRVVFLHAGGEPSVFARDDLA